jgi:hypothetical protein
MMVSSYPTITRRIFFARYLDVLPATGVAKFHDEILITIITDLNHQGIVLVKNSSP